MEDKILKSKFLAEAPLPVSRVLKRDIHEAGLEAREIVEAAERKAQELLEEGVSRRDEALDRGRQEGFREGLAQWDQARAEMLRARESLHVKYEAELVRLSVKAAEKIIGEELRTRPETIVAIVRECLRGVRNEQHLTVLVNASERDEVAQRVERLQREAGLRSLQVIADPSVNPGGCIVESERGIVDARLETQLKRLEDILLRIASRS